MQKISVIVPIYNVEKYLRQCLDSIVNQTYRDLEIILVDDGSPDACGAICDEYAETDDRIIVIHKENAGVSAARNDGIERATGEWVMFVDPDDWLELDCCESAVRTAQNVDCDVVFFQNDDVDAAGATLAVWPKHASGFISEEELVQMRLDICAGGGTEAAKFGGEVVWGKLYRRAFIINCECRFPIVKREDLFFNLLCLEYLKKAYYLDYVGYHYRQQENSVRRRYNPDMFGIETNALKWLKQFIAENYGDDIRYEKAFGRHILSCLGDIEITYCFHPSHCVTFQEYARDLDRYFKALNAYDYFEKCDISDMDSRKQRIRFYLLSRHHWRTFYCLRYILRSMKRKIAG